MGHHCGQSHSCWRSWRHISNRLSAQMVRGHTLPQILNREPGTSSVEAAVKDIIYCSHLLHQIIRVDVITALMALKLQANLSKDQSSCLGVFGLRLNTTEKDLRKVFSKCGPPSDVCMAYDLQSRQSWGLPSFTLRKEAMPQR